MSITRPRQCAIGDRGYGESGEANTAYPRSRLRLGRTSTFAALRAKSQLLAQAGERDRKIAQLVLRGNEYIHFRHRSIPLTQTA
jgi:hypothetical protein